LSGLYFTRARKRPNKVFASSALISFLKACFPHTVLF
jgi:hypothetical protein